jgi:hypothetical protein
MTRFLPGNNQNPTGRPKGARGKLKMLQEQVDSGSKEIIAKCMEMAMKGDNKAMTIIIDRILPKRKYSTDDYLKVPLPDIKTDTPDGIQKMIECLMSQGQLGIRPLPQAEMLINMYKNMLDTRLKVTHYTTDQDRLSYIESKLGIEDDKITGITKT